MGSVAHNAAGPYHHTVVRARGIEPWRRQTGRYDALHRPGTARVSRAARHASAGRRGARASARACVRQPASAARARRAVSDGVLPTFTPAASRASFFAWAVPEEPDTMAPAWPIVLPSGAVKPAT